MLILKGSWKYYWSCRTWVVLSSFSPSWVAAHTGEQTEVPATTSLDVTAVPLLPHGWNRGISLPHPWMKQEYSLWLLVWNKGTPTIPLAETGTPQPLPWMKQGYPHYPFGGNGGIPNPLLNERWVSTCIWCCVHQCKTTWDLHCRDFLSLGYLVFPTSVLVECGSIHYKEYHSPVIRPNVPQPSCSLPFS